MEQASAPRTLSPLNYSDGEQYSISRRIASGPDAGRREPTLVASTYNKRTEFINWASANGYRQVELQDGNALVGRRRAQHLRAVRRQPQRRRESTLRARTTTTSTATATCPTTSVTRTPTASPTTTSRTAACSDRTGSTCYAIEKPYYIDYQGTDLADGDTDGDGVRDGADDQDHDDIPNLMELSRFDASGGLFDGESTCKPDPDAPKPPDTNHPNAYGRVNPFNPCLPVPQVADLPDGRQRRHRRSVRRLAELVLAAVSPSRTSSTARARLRAGPGR